MRHHFVTRTAALALLGIALTAFGAGAVPQAPAPKGTLDQLLRDLSTYNGGIESAAWWKVRDYVYARKDDTAGRAECEAKLLQFLKSKATPESRVAASRLLRVIAADSAVPALQAMLADDRSADLALYVLQPMPGAAADKALLQALGSTTGSTRVAVIGATGARRMADAVPALAPLLSQPELARPAALALGAIGTDAAAQALAGAVPAAAPAVKPVLAAGVMRCAERALAAGDGAAASRLYDTLWADRSLPDALHAAAANGRISAAGTGGGALIAELLGTTDARLHQVAIGRIRDVVAAEGIAPFCALLPRLPEASQAALLATLAGYPRERVLPAILEVARSGSATVRLAALNALQSAGDASTVPVLLETATKSRGPEQAAARAALSGLKGRAVDEALLAQLSKKPGDEVAVELLLALADRRFYPAKPAVAGSLRSASPRVRSQAMKSLRLIGTPSDIPALLDLVVKTDDDTERSEAEATVSALAQKVSRAEARGREVRARLGAEKDPAARARLIALLPVVGDNSTLPMLRDALSDDQADVRDAAVRALTAWPNGAARDDIFRLARDSRDETHRLLAIRGLVRVIGAERFRDPHAAVADLRLAAGFSWRPEEQRLVLGALGQFPCAEALEVAKGFLDNPDVKAEATAAVQRIEKALK